MFKSLSDDEVLASAKQAVKEERECAVKVVDHLLEVETRRLYVRGSMTSMFDYCRQELGYTINEALLRIGAMRAVRDLPIARASLEKGMVNLSTLRRFNSFTQNEEKITGAKLETGEREMILNFIEGKSERECDRIFVELRPEFIGKKESTRVVTPELTELQFMATQEQMDLFCELRNLLGNRETAGHAGLILAISKIALAAVRKQKGIADAKEEQTSIARKGSQQKSAVRYARRTPAVKLKSYLEKSTLPANAAVDNQRSRYISRAVRAEVWRRDRGCCQFRDSRSGVACRNRFGIQLDHRIPFAKGGDSTAKNLRLMCAVHNQTRAMQDFSPEHMARFIPRLSRKAWE